MMCRKKGIFTDWHGKRDKLWRIYTSDNANQCWKFALGSRGPGNNDGPIQCLIHFRSPCFPSCSRHVGPIEPINKADTAGSGGAGLECKSGGRRAREGGREREKERGREGRIERERVSERGKEWRNGGNERERKGERERRRERGFGALRSRRLHIADLGDGTGGGRPIEGRAREGETYKGRARKGEMFSFVS